MSFVQREITKLYDILSSEEHDSPKWREAYAAKQALSWTLDPNAAASPYAYLSGERGDNSVVVEWADGPLPEDA